MSQSTETVDRAFAAALYAQDDAGLDVGASVLAADGAAWGGVGRELLARGEAYARQAWERGWRPADVLRLVRRDLDAVHLAVAGDVIAAEARRYARLPEGWGAAEVWWPADEEYAERLARRERADRFTLATAVLELYRLLVRLPSIEPVGPVPGDPAGDLAEHAHIEPRMLGRIRALLAKAEATTYPEEAEALSAKAQELMARHTVDEALLAVRGGAPAQVPGACRIGVEPPYEEAKAVLLDAVAGANRCRAVWNSAFEFSTVVGFESDLEAVELLYTSLLVQGTAAMTRAEAAQRAGGRKRTKTFRQSFLLAYASRLGRRLAETAEHTATEAPDYLPALVARDVAVGARADEMFPRTTTTRLRGATDHAGWEDGTAAADAAHVGGRRPSLP
ncbi:MULTISPECIES: DUF2786 domain-containing protein [Streptomyces]|uniref:DUF2786 domain-containing protein n=1 Tax=Streptomyces katrae TaxID=68223 RepID=A0ABT7GX51_9ACTN|nr:MULTISPECIES: DUF2786 domain-containing protein [Streptomyces]MDK9498203.1 DUF2786 domain-containing protein [Streptomyces katrae]RST00464.1 DUF2786 domain-containing protein [Streptomyces sp. WAC07149]GLX20628.1 hypothetical protein Slala01_42720 [Streptomyces lavendulae subsp. lavendulae]GLX28210.1 hypothetical protein Slala02_40300 [Streptomyces lavendulae subsp. lavendulae]